MLGAAAAAIAAAAALVVVVAAVVALAAFIRESPGGSISSIVGRLRIGLSVLSSRVGSFSCCRAAFRHLLPHLLAADIFCIVSWVRFRSLLCFQRVAGGRAAQFLNGLEFELESVELEEVVSS